MSLSSLTPFTFGAMSLGRVLEDHDEHLIVARTAMDAGVWFHASQEYAGGGAFRVLREAFDEDRANVPKLVLKIRCDNAEVLKFDVEDALRRLGVESIDLAQLCRAKHDRRPVVDDFLAKGEMWQVCQTLQREGKVKEFVMEIFASFSPDAIRAVEAGLFPAYIFYYSPGERQTSNELFELLSQRSEKILSLRTLFGGNLSAERIEALRTAEPHHPAIARFEALEPIFQKSGCASWAEFSLSFLRSMPNVLTSIAGTSKQAHLKTLLTANAEARPMDPSLATEIHSLHRNWAAD